MTSPRITGTHHHAPGNIPGLAELIDELIAYALQDFEPAPGEGGEGTPFVQVLESLTGFTDGAAVSFPTLNYYLEGSTRVYAEGLLLEPEIEWSEDGDLGGVTLSFAPAAGTQLAVEYVAEIV